MDIKDANKFESTTTTKQDTWHGATKVDNNGATKLDIKKKIQAIENEIQLLHSSHKVIVAEVHEQKNRESMNTSRLEDTSNLKSSYIAFTNKFNTSVSSIDTKLATQDNKLTTLENLVTSTLSDFKQEYTKEISNIKYNVEKEIANIRSEITNQNTYIDTQLAGKMITHASNQQQFTTGISAEMVSLKMKIASIENNLGEVKNMLIF